MIDKAALEPLARKLAERIKARTRSGKSARGDTFKAKEDGTRSNLVDTGALLNSLKPEVSEALVVTVSTEVDYAGYVQRSRPFMGMTPDDLEVVTAELRSVLNADAEERNSRK